MLSGYHTILKKNVPFLSFSCSVIDLLGGKSGCSGRFVEGFSTVFGGREPGFLAEHTREVAGVGKSAELPHLGDGALEVLQDIHRAVDADQHLELAGRHARVGAKLAQGGKLVDMDDLGDLREGAGVAAFAQVLDGPIQLCVAWDALFRGRRGETEPADEADGKLRETSIRE